MRLSSPRLPGGGGERRLLPPLICLTPDVEVDQVYLMSISAERPSMGLDGRLC